MSLNIGNYLVKNALLTVFDAGVGASISRVCGITTPATSAIYTTVANVVDIVTTLAIKRFTSDNLNDGELVGAVLLVFGSGYLAAKRWNPQFSVWNAIAISYLTVNLRLIINGKK